MRWVNGKLETGQVVGLCMSKENARRLTSHFISTARDFIVLQTEGHWIVYVDENVNLTRLQERFPDIRWELEL